MHLWPAPVTHQLSHSLATLVPFEQSGNHHQTMIVVISHAVGALLCLDLARRKNRNATLWAWVGLLFGPLAAIILLLLPSRVNPASQN
ncbi:MAG: hypothetical protein EA402_14470 [Planctomycetota bacterium]|nr:MAG: hypothetical protein EA402_14470 [Planctomycetota bacterium]